MAVTKDAKYKGAENKVAKAIFFRFTFFRGIDVAQILVKKCVNSVSTNEWKLQDISGDEYDFSIRYVWNMAFVRSVKVMTIL
ncbi:MULTISPECIES: hypothetical protein [Vibrio diabolicus subgroup]|uniref:hypothetical protein n=1 Tax=Vibrio diabolicus subgroup TaxID=2315253 RepID=UPI000940A2FC|nr:MULTISPECIES: hypothetical protein [Vibrio diabolicus subgroup]MDV5035852.1 hypothetical protein [Vibrio diabolicus]OKQ14492.1 hypothetical protein H058_09560 [Vibrio antiquarius]BDR17359.1 hypothetical protein VspSTUT16_07050 [Vibrio sp. STUT-A16]